VVENAQVLWKMVHPEAREHIRALVTDSARTLESCSLQCRILPPSGHWKWLEICGQPERRANGDTVWDVLALDISDRKQAEAALRASEERLRLVTENMSDLVCLHAPDGRYSYATPSSALLLGYAPEELVERAPWEFARPEERDRVRKEYQRASSGAALRLLYCAQTKTGEAIWLETLVKPIEDVSGRTFHLQTTSRDVSDRVVMVEKLRLDALYDSLTNLPNRTLLLERLDAALARARCQPDFQFAILFLDLDHFKVVNDSLGHHVGDCLLVEVARQLDRFLREGDLAARLGGDEFVILLEEIDGTRAVKAAERLLHELQKPMRVGDREIFVNASVGVLAQTDRYRQAEDLLRDADLAMYRAKSRGRGQYAVFDPRMHAQVVERLDLESDLRRALPAEEFFLHYQPIVDLATGEVQGFEALIRWQHPQRGLLAPREFIAVAEEAGFLVAIGEWVLHEACRQLVEWQGQFPDRKLRVGINLSVSQLQDALPDRLQAMLASFGLSGRGLVLEITESMLVQNVETTRHLRVSAP